MGERKRSLRPLETLKKDERELLYKQVHSEVQSYHYESQTIRLLKKEKKQREIEDQLADKMIEYKRKNSELEDFSRKLKDDQEKTRMQINSRRTAIQTFDHKGKQESEKLNKEIQMIASKVSEIRKKQEEKHQVQLNLEEIDRKIEYYSIYKKILLKVVQNSEDYEEISQLINRCRTLKNSVNNLSQSYRKLEEETEKEKESFFKEINILNEEIGVCTGLIHKLESEIEKLNTEIGEIQSKQEQQRISRIEHKAQIAKVELSIKNIYSKAMQSKPSTMSKPKGEEERKIRMIGNENKAIKTNSNERESEDPDLLVFMLQRIRERYIDLKRISETVQDEVITSKPTIMQSLVAEDQNTRSKLLKRATIIKNFETTRTNQSNNEGI